jgi:hypothetical protein
MPSEVFFLLILPLSRKSWPPLPYSNTKTTAPNTITASNTITATNTNTAPNTYTEYNTYTKHNTNTASNKNTASSTNTAPNTKPKTDSNISLQISCLKDHQNPRSHSLLYPYNYCSFNIIKIIIAIHSNLTPVV